MGPRATRLLLPFLLGLIAVLVLARMALLTPAFTDYEHEAQPAFDALRAGHVSGFLHALPAYGGSLILRAPLALLPGLWGGGSLAVFRAVAAPGLAAALAFGLVLWSGLAGPGRRGTAAAWLALALVAANPMTLNALETGHSEELLGAVLCAAAVASALRDRPVLAGVLLGLAMANKPWAIVAVLPVVAALRGGRLRALVVSGGLTAIVLAPMVAAGTGVSNATDVATNAGAIFQPWQAWWFLGHHGEVVHGVYGVKAGYRTGPSWIAHVPHVLVVLLPLALSALVVAARRLDLRRDALLLLALALLLRCVLDPWNAPYYALPFLIALTAHEAFARRRAPIAAMLATAACYLTTVGLASRISPDASAALYLAWALPLTAALMLRVTSPRTFAAIAAPARAWAQRQMPALARLLRQPEHGWEQVPGSPAAEA